MVLSRVMRGSAGVVVGEGGRRASERINETVGKAA